MEEFNAGKQFIDVYLKFMNTNDVNYNAQIMISASLSK